MELVGLEVITYGLESLTGLLIECVGVSLIAGLFFFLARSIRRTSLYYWTIAWVCLWLSLLSLALAFRFELFRETLLSIYFLGKYGFGFMLIAGCRNYANGTGLAWRQGNFLMPVAVLAFVLPHLTSDFNKTFIPHAAVMSILFLVAFHALRPARHREKSSPELGVVSVALILLALDFLHYIPVFTLATADNSPLLREYLRYSSIYDLILEMLLGFGMVMVVMEDIRRQVEAANQELI